MALSLLSSLLKTELACSVALEMS